jgi:uncharacterized membrane protein YeiH
MPLIQTIEFVAVMVSAIYGILLAARKGMDFVGLFSVAFTLAFGGGTLRDLFLDRHPLFWIEHGHYAIWVFGLAFIGAVLPRLMLRLERFLPIPDAMGMALFTVVGTGYAVAAETPLFVASMIGVITGTFGGVIGDVICNEVPSLFKPSTPLYATCAFAGSWAFLGAMKLGWNESVSMLIGAGIAFVIRLLAIRFDWRLPSPRINSSEHDEPSQ